jgi:alkylation response protein AidB-like acyl-CoA dehydrogenase
MDFAWTDEQAAFRARVRALLAQHLPADWEAQGRLDPSSEYVTAFARRFCPILAAEGLLTPHWPAAFGGADADAWTHWILNEEMTWAGEPRGYQYMSVNWAGPALIRFGTDAQKAEHLPRIARGELFYCQGFSEPNAGSDLASLTTRAERRDGGYVVRGQKIWTSAASFADYCVLLARTGPGRKDISVLLAPMTLPGITVRVIEGFQGQRAFHEIFFDDVELPASCLLGEENRGWSVVTAILHNERVGMPRYMLSLRGLDDAVGWLQREGRFGPIEVVRAAETRAACEAVRLQCYRVIDGRVKGRPPTVETSLARYSMMRADRMTAQFVAEFCGPALIGGEQPVMAAAYRRAAATGIASGTAEVQLNLIARDHLQLPRAA